MKTRFRVYRRRNGVFYCQDRTTGKQAPAPHIVVHDEHVIEVVKRQWKFMIPSGDGSTLNFPLGEVAGAPLVLVDLGIAIRLSRAYFIARKRFSPTWGGGYIEGDCQCVAWGFGSFDHETDTWYGVQGCEQPVAAYYARYYAERYGRTGCLPPDTMDREAVAEILGEISGQDLVKRFKSQIEGKPAEPVTPAESTGIFHGLPPLDELKRSASKTKFVEDPKFAAMDTQGRVDAYEHDRWTCYNQKVCSRHGITHKQLSLLHQLMKWGHEHLDGSGNRRFEHSAALAAALNSWLTGAFAPDAVPTDLVVTPQEIEELLERLFKKAGKDSCGVDIIGIERKALEETGADGKITLVPHYRFGVAFGAVQEDVGEYQPHPEHLIRLGVIVRTAEGQW